MTSEDVKIKTKIDETKAARIILKEILSCIESFIALKSVLMRNSFKHIFGLDRNVGFKGFILAEKLRKTNKIRLLSSLRFKNESSK